MPLNGITIKNVKEFTGHEFPVCTQGDVWDGKTKLGFWSQDSWGGPDDYEGDSEKIIQVKAKALQRGFDKKRYKDPIMYDVLSGPDVFMGFVATMHDIEKMFKDVTKGIAPGVEFTVLFFKLKNGNMYAYRTGGVVNSLADLPARTLEDIEKWLGTKEYLFWVARWLSDFDIQVDENHPAPEYLYDEMYCTMGGVDA